MVFVYGTFHIVSGIVQFYADLPVPVSEYTGEFWLVQENSGGLLSAFGIYKYPKGIYASNLSNIWEQVPFSVKVSEDTVTLVNITNWAEYIDYAIDINIGDRIVYLDIIYKNKTGNQTTTPPDTDTTNWQVSGVMSENTECALYVDGDESTDGSKRFTINPETDITRIEERIEGIWQPASLETAVESLWIGQRLGVSTIGHHLLTADSNTLNHLYAHSQFDGKLSISDAKIINAVNYLERNIFQPDFSNTWIGTVYDFIILSDEDFFVLKGYVKTYNIAASEPVRFEVWEGTDDTGWRIFNQLYPPSFFPANQETSAIFDGYVEFRKDHFYFIRFSSIATFSLRVNAAGNLPWLAIDNSEFREDDMLQVVPWVSGNTYTKNESWTIQNNKIYACNKTGIQLGTFEDNINKWTVLTGNPVNIGSILVKENNIATAITTKDTFVDLNLNASAVEASDIELWTLTNTTTGELRYDGLYTVCLNYTGLVAAYSTGGTQRFNFRLLKNGSPLDPPDDVNIPLEIRVTIGSSYLLWSIVVNPGDLFRMQVENADGTSDITIDTLKVSIK